MTRCSTLVVAIFLAFLFVAPAEAAWFVGRDAKHVQLQVNSKGEALLTYEYRGALRRVLLWGAINGQQEFAHAYDGGARKYHMAYWETFPSRCDRYDGPPLDYRVKACGAPDGSYWAVQQWPVPLPDLGYAPWLPKMKAMWLEVSHWRGPLAVIHPEMDWVAGGAWQQVFVRLTYRGRPAPHSYIHLDTFNSVYGPGWHREDADPTLATGLFCYQLVPHDPNEDGYHHPPGERAVRGPGIGERYRITARGPGVTPDVATVIQGIHPFEATNPDDLAFQDKQTALLESWGGKRDGRCSQNWFEP